MLDALCAGEVLWDLATPEGASFADAASLSLDAGGGALGVARHLAAKGLRVGLSASFGLDALGDAMLARVERLGVDTSDVERDAAAIGLFFSERRAPSERQVSARRPAATFGALRSPARALVISGITPDAPTIDRLIDVARRYRKAGSLVVIDANARRSLWRGKRAELERARALLREASLVRASREDIEAMGSKTKLLARVLQDKVAYVLTDGTENIHVSLPGLCSIEWSNDLVETDQTMGAGDAFTASLVASILDAGSLDQPLATTQAWISRARADVRALLRSRLSAVSS